MTTLGVASLFSLYVVLTLISGAAQDLLYTKYEFNETDAMSLVQSFVLFLLGAFMFLYKSSCQKQVAPTVSPTAVPLYMQLALGASIAGNVLLTNYATEYLSFPVQVIFKSAKLLVAMLIRATVFKKPNKRIDYYCGIMLSLGLIGFMWPDSPSEGEEGTALNPTFAMGILCVVGSLIAEAAMLNIQEFYLFNKYGVSTDWVMMYGYLHSTLSQLVLLVVAGKLVSTMELLFGALEPMVSVLLVVFPLFMWAGVSFLLLLVKHHGSVAASAANVIRKIIAVGFSFVYFGRAITVPIALGTLLVFGSIIWRATASEGHGHSANTISKTASSHAHTAPSSAGGLSGKDENPSARKGDSVDEGDDEEMALLMSPSTKPTDLTIRSQRTVL